MLEYIDSIKALRERMEKSVLALKEFEKKGDKDSAERALYECYYAWNSKEYTNLELLLKIII